MQKPVFSVLIRFAYSLQMEMNSRYVRLPFNRVKFGSVQFMYVYYIYIHTYHTDSIGVARLLQAVDCGRIY